MNEPINRVASRNVQNDEEKRWWEWKINVQDDTDWKSKRRSASNSGPRDTQFQANSIINGNGIIDGYQTTYQKELGYLNKVNEGSAKNGDIPNRHSYNPNNSNAVGIVPVNDLNSFSQANEPQRVFLDKMSFEHHYDSRNDSNYPNRGKVSLSSNLFFFSKKSFY
jgi:hypothetical protein